MKQPIHIEGLGLTGSLLAHTLARYGVPFTWNDTEAQHTAWKASTGAIYPSGSEKFGPDMECYHIWEAWYRDNYFSRAVLERCNYVFKTKAPPHGGKYAHLRTSHNLGMASIPSFHFNAQAFVEETRRRFEASRLYQPYDHMLKIVAHGWGDRLAHTYWGWTRLVQLEYPGEYAFANAGTLTPVQRPAFYFRPDKFTMAYAYPVPGTPWWYAGSSILKQKLGAEKSLDMASKYEKWKETFHLLGNGAVRVTAEGELLEGWRPAAAKEDTAWLRRRGNVLTVRPLWNSGIRHYPKQWAQIAHNLGLVA